MKSARRNGRKKLPYFDLWNEIYDEYLSWLFSLSIVLYAHLRKQRRGRSLSYEFYRAVTILLFRIIADLLAIRLLCRSGFDVAAKVVARSTIEHIDVLILVIREPEISKIFNRLDNNQASNAFWHKHVSRGKVWKILAPVWKEKFGPDFNSIGWMDWLYRHHEVLGMSVHPSFSGSVFSTLTLGSGTNDNWLGFLGDRAEISTDTFYSVALHVWKLTVVAESFPFSIAARKELAVHYIAKDEFHRHAKIGGELLASMLVTFWDKRVRKEIFKKVDTSNIWRRKKNNRRARTKP